MALLVNVPIQSQNSHQNCIAFSLFFFHKKHFLPHFGGHVKQNFTRACLAFRKLADLFAPNAANFPRVGVSERAGTSPAGLPKPQCAAAQPQPQLAPHPVPYPTGLTPRSTFWWCGAQRPQPPSPGLSAFEVVRMLNGWLQCFCNMDLHDMPLM